MAVGTKDAAELVNKYVTISNVVPDASGNISIQVTRGADNIYQALISAIRLSNSE